MQDYEEDRLGFLMRTRAQFGDLVRFDQRSTIVHSLDLAREVLGDRTGAYAIRQNFLTQNIPEAELGAWLGVRKLVSPGLRRPVAESFATSVAAELDAVFEASTDRTHDTVSLLERVTSRSIARYCFGPDGSGIPEPAGQLLDALARIIGNPLALPSAVPTLARRRVRHRLRELEAVISPLLRARASTSPDDAHPDLASEMLARRDEALGQSPERIQRTLIGLMLAAHRVPAAAASWMLLLARGRADLWREVTAEGERFRELVGQDRFVPGLFPTAMTVVHESLRLYPATWLMSRQTTGEVELGGFHFGRDHQLLISPYVIQRDAAVFDNPDAFRPSRWRNPTPAMSQSYLPFGAGPRSCPGNHVAVSMMMAILLASTSWPFVLDDRQVRADPRTTLMPAGLQIGVAARN